MVDVYPYRKDNPRARASLLYWASRGPRTTVMPRPALSRAKRCGDDAWHPTVIQTSTVGAVPVHSTARPLQTPGWTRSWWTVAQLAYHEVGELTRRGVPGVWTHGFFDGWAPNYMFYAANGHNAIGRFYETFGNGGADTKDRTVRAQSERTWYRPNPPLPKVRWSLRNNVNLQQSGAAPPLSKWPTTRSDSRDFMKSKRSIEKALRRPAPMHSGGRAATGGGGHLCSAEDCRA